MSRVRARRWRDRAFPPIEVELTQGIDRSAYAWKLSRFLLDNVEQHLVAGDHSAAAQLLLLVRDHETRMFARYPDGPTLRNGA